MKNRFLTIYSVLVSIIFVFSLSFFTLNLIYEYNHGAERTKRRFDHMENVINNAKNETQISNAIGDLNDFSYLKITTGNNTVFIYPSPSSIQNPETKLVKNYCSSRLNENNTFYMEASLYTLRPYTIHYYAKISFLIIILATTITLIIIICIALDENKSTAKIEEIEELSEEATEEENNLNQEILNKKIEIEQSETKDEIKLDETIETSAVNKETEQIILNDTASKTDEEVKEIEKTADKADKTVKIDLPEDQSKPINLETTEKKELQTADEMLELRLEKELNRAISSEIDLSLFLIRIPEIQKEHTIYQDVQKKLEEDFQYKDLIFEVNNDCFAAIKLNTSIDDAINFADIINHSVNDIISAENKVCYIGIAARTLRMVSAKRLIFESKEALVHAQQDSDTPIVAFKVDSEKYMRMMEN